MATVGPDKSTLFIEEDEQTSTTLQSDKLAQGQKRALAPIVLRADSILESPTKMKLIEAAVKLPPPSPKARDVVGTGDQCMVLSNGHHEVLIVTRYLIAKKFEILRDAFNPIPTDLPFHIPEFVARNQDIPKLQAAHRNPKNEKFFKEQYAIYEKLLKENYVYKLVKYDGTLEDFFKLHYTEFTIDLVRQRLQSALSALHDKNITHNDLSPKNIFYKGGLPSIVFYLGDFGSITVNNAASHPEKVSRDLSKLNGILEQMKRKLDYRHNDPYTPYRKLTYDEPSLAVDVIKQQKKYGLRKRQH